MELLILAILALLISLLYLAGIFFISHLYIQQINHLCDRIQTKSAEQSRYLQQVVAMKPEKEQKNKDELTAEELVGY